MRWRVPLSEQQSVRSLFSRDFVTLTGTSHDASSCLDFAYLAPGATEGLIQVFRRPACAATTMSVVMVGLKPSATYVVEDRDDGSTLVSTGAALMSSGGPVVFTEQPQAKLYTFKVQ